MGEGVTVRLWGKVKEDVLLDTDSQQEVTISKEASESQNITSPGMRDENGGQEPLVNAVLPDPSSGERLKLSGVEMNKAVLEDTKVQSMRGSAEEETILVGQDIIKPDSSTPQEGRGGLSDASQTTPSVGQNNSLHSQPAPYRALCRSEHSSTC